MDFFVTCHQCGRSYARSLLSGSEARCRCGARLLDSRTPGSVDPEALQQEEAALQELRRLTDHISFLIVATDTPRVDVDIEKANVRRRCAELFPDKLHVFDLVYESRFQRLWDQFRLA
jgi:hypothetical protein